MWNENDIENNKKKKKKEERNEDQMKREKNPYIYMFINTKFKIKNCSVE